MTKKRISAIAAVMAMAMMTTSAMPAFAAETTETSAPAIVAYGSNDTPDNPVGPPPTPDYLPTYGCYEVSINGYYSTVAVANNCNNRLYIGTLPYGYKVDVRMLSGSTVVYEESGAITGNSNRTFWCGSNVTAVQARVTNWDGTASSSYYTLGVDTHV